MQALSVAQIREVENDLIFNQGFPVEFLMENAGKAVAECLHHNIVNKPYPQANKRICLFAGKGNNGGDAFAAAYFLKDYSYEPYVFLFADTEELKGAALFWFNKVKEKNIFIKNYTQEENFKKDFEMFFYKPDFFIGAVDGLLGIGTKGAPKGIILEAIKMLNRMSQYVPIFAIDVPSGLDCDTGQVAAEAVFADYTITMGYPKIGLLNQSATEYVGRIEVADIAAKPHYQPILPKSEIELITKNDVLPLFKRRMRNSHKGSYGELLIFAGSTKYSGAARLAALGASYSGTGLIKLAVPKGIYPVVSTITPQCIYYGMGEDQDETLDEKAWDYFVKTQEILSATAILIGPGLTKTSQTQQLVKKIIKEATQSLVIDADALNILAEDLSILKNSPAQSIVLTPHPGEMARLLQTTSTNVQNDRIKSLKELLEKLSEKVVVVLKGSGTLVARKDTPIFININGNPGMAKGGSGDILAGLMAGLIASGLNSLEAAIAAVYVHSRAGDIAAKEYSEVGFSMLHLADAIPLVFSEFLLR